MVYEELSIPAIQKEWEQSFVERYRMFSTVGERNKTIDSMLKNQEPFKNEQTHPVTLKIFVKSDTDEQIELSGLENSNRKKYK